VRAPPQVPTEHEPAAHTRPQRQEEHIAQTPSRSKMDLAQKRQVGIVVDQTRLAEFLG
jgi:hypothetical protein